MDQPSVGEEAQPASQGTGQQTIHCSVKNCHYWEKGNKCSANEILVTSDEMAMTLPDAVDAPHSAQVAQTPVSRCIESCCKTFVQKNDFSRFQDGVMKQ